MPLFDTHAHLHFPELLADLDAVLERARAAGVTGMVTIGTDRETNPAAVALAERLPDVWATVGIHPHDAGGGHGRGLRGDGAAGPRVGPGGGARRDGARLLPRPLAPRRAGDGAAPPARHGAPARQAGRHPLPRRAPGGPRDPLRGARRRGRRRHALLLGRRGGGQALPRPGPDDLARRAGDLQERAGASRRRALRARRPPGGGDRLPVPAARIPIAGSATSPRGWPSPPRTWPSCAASRPRRSARPSPRTRTGCSGIPTR